MNDLKVVRQAAESKPDDPIYRLMLAMLECNLPIFNYQAFRPSQFGLAIEKCAREIEAAK